MQLEKPNLGYHEEDVLSLRVDGKRRWRAKVAVSVVLVGLWYWFSSTWSLTTSFSTHANKTDNKEIGVVTKTGFSWHDIIPSKELEYTPCFDNLLCARLDVPLNWNASDRDSGPRAAIAIVKVPARVPITDPRYGGPILMNPGGPGESGVSQVLRAGKYLQIILDSPISPTEPSDGKYFEIIGFDPRGVNNTTPRLRCFPDAFNQQYWQLKFPDYSFLWDDESVLGMEWARAQAMGSSCQREHDEHDMARYSNTVQTVEDMLEFLERHGQWRDKMTSSFLSSPSTPSLATTEQQEIRERTAYKPGNETLQYWGTSYGTLLGQTFAAMHPSRVHRLVLDGVVDPQDHYSGTWLTQLQDFDKIISQLARYCFDAGPASCPLYLRTSAQDIEERFTAIMDALRYDPIPVPARGDFGPEVVSWGDMLLFLLSGAFFPYSSAESLYTMLSEIESGNGTRVANIKQSILSAASVPAECIRDGPFSDACVTSTYVSGMGSFQTISCMDINGRNGNLMKEEFREWLKVVRRQSKWGYTTWARNKLACLGYSVKPAWTFEGGIGGETRVPMLVVGNTHDTVTPLRNAKKVTALFPGSVVLQQDSQGHCSYSMPSLCTGKTIREYFQTGKLPETGTVCAPDWKPFIGCVNKDENGDCKKLNEEDQVLWDAMVGAAD